LQAPWSDDVPVRTLRRVRLLTRPSLILLLGIGSALVLAGPARAATIEPCPGGTPVGKVVYKGAFTHSLTSASRGALRSAGVRLRPIRPANALDGTQELPVRSVSWKGRDTTVRLGGGLRLERSGRSLALRQMRVVLKPRTPRVVVGRVGSRELRLFTLNRTKVRKQKGRVSEIELTSGTARLTGAVVRLMRSRLGIRGLRKGSPWSRPDLFVEGAGGAGLVGDLPPEAPPIDEPSGSIPIESASIEWRLRESFVSYLTGNGGFVRPVEPATPGPPESFEGGPKRVYRFEIPFASGWVAGESKDAEALVNTSGGVRFQLCPYTINFALIDPEVNLDGDSSRLIVRAEGTDGTPYDGRRIVLLRLFPSRAESVETSGRQTDLKGIPAYVAEGAAGVFISYPAFPTDGFRDPSVELSRFGSVSINYTRAASG